MDQLGVWDDEDGLYYDKLVTPDGTEVPIKVRSMVGVIPLLAAVVIDETTLERAQSLGKRVARLVERLGGRDGLIEPGPAARRARRAASPARRGGPAHLLKVFTKLFDENEFLSPYGLRAVSAYHRDHPYELTVEDCRR